MTNFAETLNRIAAGMPLRAAGFIVTLYGDAVVPRGGEVWIGTIIETCAALGISDTLVRTAVSRLVAAGQLEGRRQGRRSFYRLSGSARSEFDAAARLIYGPPEEFTHWRFLHLPEDGAEARMAQLERQGYARLRPHLAVGPARGPVPEGLFAFEAIPEGAPLLPAFAAQVFDLAPHAIAYRALCNRFAPLEGLTPASGAEALTARLLLVHAWRHALLRDPRLPHAALPVDWPGHEARALFHRLYAALSPMADSHIGARFEGAEGVLPITPAGRGAQKDEAGQRLRGEVRLTG